MTPPPPARLSMTTCCPSDSVRRLPMTRAIRSTPPPGGNGTSSLSGRDGYSAVAAVAHAAKVSDAASRRRFHCIVLEYQQISRTSGGLQPRGRDSASMTEQVYAHAAVMTGQPHSGHSPAGCPVEETLCPVVAHEWVNDEYKHLVVKATPKALAAQPGQFFHLLCPSPDEGEVWFRRPQSVYRVARSTGRVEFLYKVAGRGTKGLTSLEPGDTLNMLGPLGVGFKLEPQWKNVVVLGRGVGLATMAPISQLAGERGVRVTAILSARSEELAMAADLFETVGTVIKVLDTDGTSAVENVEAILRRLIAERKADAFFTCGSNRLMQLMKRLGKAHGIPAQMAMEQIMACGLGPCYICVRTFEVNGKLEMRRVCVEGPVFDLQECLGW